MRRYTADREVPIAASVTVCEPIAERYAQELGLHPLVVYNAPKPVMLGGPLRAVDPNHIRLIHHGFAKRGRGLHGLVEALAYTHERFELHFMLVSDDAGYVDELKRLGDRLAPGRVHFHDPVPPDAIVETVSQYDVGFCVIEPSSYNNLMMLPNKFFEYVQAGLAVCVGPSPAMVALVRQHGFGITTPSFDPREVAAALITLTDREIMDMQRAARLAAAVLNADVEMEKIVNLYRRLLRPPETGTGPNSIPDRPDPRGGDSGHRSRLSA
jgi:glycosyltransferase involved in cell wall biosynthesis